MNEILKRLSVLLSLMAFGIVTIVGIATNVGPMVTLFRATVAFILFGFFGRMGIRVVLKGILEELARHRKEEKDKKKAAEQEIMKAKAEKVEETAASTTPVTEIGE